MTNFGFTADYDPPRILVVVAMPGTHVATTVQKVIVRKEGREEGKRKWFFKFA